MLGAASPAMAVALQHDDRSCTARQAACRASIHLTMLSPHLQASRMFDGKLNILVSSSQDKHALCRNW
jgi:hypothetical protein